MRLPPYATLLRVSYTLTTFSGVARATIPASRQNPARPGYYLQAMPFSSLFGFGSNNNNNNNNNNKMSFPDQRTPDEWRAVLNKDQFRILREKGTEPPGSHKFDKFFSESGVYTCAGCNAPLYKANHKFKSGCGWPAYFDSIPGAVTRHEDRTWGMTRTEIVCSNCGGHLGHVFKGEGYPTPTDERHCVNGVSLNFSPDDPVKKDGSA
ncbi:SelR-domain-containing protein [Poronia punctata]|nr:SelR-domain-containing protein [Poronia punctata]